MRKRVPRNQFCNIVKDLVVFFSSLSPSLRLLGQSCSFSSLPYPGKKVQDLFSVIKAFFIEPLKGITVFC